MKLVKVFYDTETTDLDPKYGSIHQLAGIIEVDGKAVERFDFRIAPHHKARIDPKALDLAGVDELDIECYPRMNEVNRKFCALMGKYVDQYNRKDKAHLIGYNNRSFDDLFLRAWFKQCGNPYFGSFFWADSIDVLCLASQHLLERRASMPNFQLKTVARTLGIEIDPSGLHAAAYDAEITRNIYLIASGIE